MKKNLLLFCFFVLVACNLFSQVEKYHRIKIFTDEAGLSRLSSLGVTVDHGEYKKGVYFASEFTDSELKIIRQNNFKYEVIINDMATYYTSRNKNIDNAADMTDLATTCKYPVPQNFRLGTMGGFYTLADMLRILDTMRIKYPNLISIKSEASSITTAEGRKLFYVRISNNPDVLQKKPRILYSALHHAREPESLTQLIYYMWYLLENYNTNTEIKDLVNSCEMYFVPCVNPDGYVYNQTTNPNGGGFWRKNRRNNGGSFGVDLNRNYGYEWGYDNSGSSPSPSSDTYRGTSGFSEPETQVMRDFCIQYKFKLALNNHTYSNLLIYPWGFKANFFTKDSLAFKQYAQTLTQCNHFQSGTANQTVGYLANGTSDDWMYGDKTMKPKVFAMTPETGSFSDGFWPAQNRILPIARKNLDMNINAAKFGASFAKTTDVTEEKINAAKKNSIIVFQNSPNPSTGITYIKYSLNNVNIKTGYSLNIYNSFGRNVKTINLGANENNIAVNTADLQPGLYYYSIGNKQDKSTVMKMVVSK